MKNSQTSEVIDLLLPETVCNDMTDFPIRVEGATGGLLLRNTPIICGGWNITHNLQCYIIGNNEISIDLIHRYVHITASKWALLLLKSLFQKIDGNFFFIKMNKNWSVLGRIRGNIMCNFISAKNQ